MLAAKVTLAETAVSNDALRRISAVLEGAALFLGWHTASQWKNQVQSRLSLDGVIGKGSGGRGEMFAREDEAEVRWWNGGPDGEKS